MKILQLCKKFPFPLRDGESLAVTYLAKALSKLGNEVTLLAMNTTKHHVQVGKVKQHLKHYKAVHYTALDNEVKPLHAFLNLFSSDSYNISRFDNAAFRNKLTELLKRTSYDLIQLESLYLAPYIDVIRQYSTARIALRAHNVEYEIWQRMAENEDVALRRWYLEYSSRKLRKYEIEQLENIDLLLPISSIDERKFQELGYEGPTQSLPIGLDLAKFNFKQVEARTPQSVSFIGSLDWMPNIEGLNWFLDQVWPHIVTIFPKLRLKVAGRNCPPWLRDIQMKNLEVVGEVDDSSEFLLQHPIMVVPLLSGSGMRAKIVEAMALGRIVITTPLGLEGISAKDKQEVLVAHTVDEFIRKFRFCYHHKRHLPNLSLNARKLTEEHFDHINVGKRLVEAYHATS